MTPSGSATPHLFDCWDEITRKIHGEFDIWIFLDFDGTLVRYYDRPEDVKLSGECRRVLTRLIRHRRVHIVIVSGRRNAALRQLIRVPRMKFMGLFGWERSRRPALPRKARRTLHRLRSLLAPLPEKFPGILVENKDISYAVHFRGASPEAQQGVRNWVRGLLRHIRPDFRVIQSNHACEIVHRDVQGKGIAMRDFTRALQTPFLPIYVGDDLTDEPAFVSLRRGITVRVAPVSQTKAAYRLSDPGEVCVFLKRLEKNLSLRSQSGRPDLSRSPISRRSEISPRLRPT